MGAGFERVVLAQVWCAMGVSTFTEMYQIMMGECGSVQVWFGLSLVQNCVSYVIVHRYKIADFDSLLNLDLISVQARI